MNIKKMKLAAIILAIGLILAAVSCLITGIVKEPVIKEHSFDYAITYKLDGIVNTYEGSFKCSFMGYDAYDDPTARQYTGVHQKNGAALEAFYFPVAEKDGVKLNIVIDLNAAYLMGDPDRYEYEPGNTDPYFEALQADDYWVEVSNYFDAEILSWDYPEPIENSFRFAGFSRLHAISMLAMLLIGYLTMLACIIAVKKDPDICYKVLDGFSTAINFIIGLWVIPFIAILVFVFPLAMDPESLIYQIYLCVPAFTAFAIAASVALRRKGFTKSGFFVQLAIPVLFFVPILVLSLIENLFS